MADTFLMTQIFRLNVLYITVDVKNLITAPETQSNELNLLTTYCLFSLFFHSLLLFPGSTLRVTCKQL